MKIPLQYQRTEYDCGPTALLNAISFLFHREEIPPDILRYIFMYTLDSFNQKGEACKSGTSQMAMMFLSNWMNQYAKTKRLPIACEYLDEEGIMMTKNSRLVSAIQQGGVVVVRLYYGCDHYVTLTGLTGESVLLFDPYFRKRAFAQEGIDMIHTMPCVANRRVDFSALNKETKTPYALGPPKKREAVLIFNTKTRQTPETSIEYFL